MDFKIYLAGTCTFGIAKGQLQYNKLLDTEKPYADGVRHRLESYHYVGSEKKVKEMRAAGVKVFLDSGAFSAHTLGVDMSLPDYCEYVKANKDIVLEEDGVLLASVLDGIGDAQATYDNQRHMEYLGVKPLPCFHQGEDERYLEYYMANYEYITLGGMVGSSWTKLEVWLDRIWSRYLIDGSGKPRLKVHGFGITKEELMVRYPWHSVDSSTWIQATSFGGIFIPGYGILNISAESPMKHNWDKHIDTMSEVERNKILGLIRSQGFDPDVMISRYLGRATYNLWAFGQRQEAVEAMRDGGLIRTPLNQELF